MTLSFFDPTDSNGLAPEEATIANRIRDAILERRLPPGSKLPEEHLAETFATTRARVRRVLLALSREHIIVLQPARGASVARPTPEDAMHILAARRVLEIGTVEHPCRKLTDEAYETLRATIERERESHRQNDSVNMIRLSGQFHLELALAVGNPVIAAMLRDLILRTSLIIALFERRKATCCLTMDHGQILAAIHEGATMEAARLMARHLLEIEGNMDFSLAPPPVTSLSFLLAPS
ncbi:MULTISPECIES: GntR family transcriptional regulator [Nguyenibacter]|uniref:GntR family transcriptional regulator n=2 Tax=Nguyenibacter vanlangensis TaxID=1216886 RepID=A0A7Y7IUZ9_9PROT|nr:GntR family transcriptional regulator [Nguyenibacter sp. L1]NVN10836.1 GntR family transcriptional regulator [Nguyenibacter vanlangensis]WRH88997.1 GntR family transcriptional regulator [Nguyenibacter sp. L1]